MKFLFLFPVCIMLINCNTEKSTAHLLQSHVESYLKDHGYAGEDYAFVSITGIDTVTEKEFLDRQLELLSLGLTNKEGRLRRLDSLELILKKALSLQPKDQTIITNLRDITRSKTDIYVQQHKMDSLQATSSPTQAEKVKFIGMDFTFRSKDAAGVSALHQCYIKTDEQLNVLSVIDLRR